MGVLEQQEGKVYNEGASASPSRKTAQSNNITEDVPPPQHLCSCCYVCASLWEAYENKKEGYNERHDHPTRSEVST
jgi:hypothetical protein